MNNRQFSYSMTYFQKWPSILTNCCCSIQLLFTHSVVSNSLWLHGLNKKSNFNISSVQFGLSVLSDSLWPHRLQHGSLPCPSPIHRAYSNSGPLSRWCHPAISSSVVPFSSCLQSFPASWSFQMNQFFTLWLKYCCFSFSISPSNEYSGLISFRIDWFDLLAVQGTLKSLL